MISPVHTWVAKRTGLGENLTPETLRCWQEEKLRELIQYAGKNSRFYRNVSGSSSHLTELPFTLPADITGDPFAFLAIPQSHVVRVTTLANSGTTRKKKRIPFSKDDLERTVDFFAAGMSTMVSRGEHAQILLSNRTENSLGSLLRESLSRIGVTSEITGAIKNVNAAINVSRGAGCLVGMPAEMFYMSRIAPDLRPRSVLLAADYIPEAVIDSIKETWQCHVFSHYGHSEFGFGCAVDCEQHNGLHLRDADLIFEIIDPKTGKPVNHGEKGEIVITTLSHEAMPLIRYCTGNISCILHEPCKCGAVLPRLGRIEGRYESNIPVHNNKTLSIHQLDDILFANPKVYGFDAFLKDEGRKTTLQLMIDAYEHINKDSLAAKLPRGLTIEIEYGKADPFTHRGKRRIHRV